MKEKGLRSYRWLRYLPDYPTASRKTDSHTLKSTSSMSPNTPSVCHIACRKAWFEIFFNREGSEGREGEGSPVKELYTLNPLPELFCFYNEIGLSKSKWGFGLNRPRRSSILANLRPRFYLMSKCLQCSFICMPQYRCPVTVRLVSEMTMAIPWVCGALQSAKASFHI